MVHGVRRCSRPGWKPDRETEREERQDQGVPVPTANSGPNEITSSHGTLWFTEDYGNQIGRIKNNGKITEFPVPTGGSRPYGIARGPDRNVWFTEYGGGNIGRITPKGVVTEFPVPSGSGLYEITSGPLASLWFTEWSANKIGRITKGGVITEFDLPAGGGGPYDIVEGPDGNLWYTRADVSGPCGSPDSGNAIGRMTPTGSVVEYPLPNSDSRPFGIAAGRDGNLWFAECSGNRIGRITPTGTIDEQDIPSADSEPYGIASGPQNSLWFTEYSGNRVGRLPAP